MSKTPKLRFKEFSGDWEEKKFNAIFLDIKNKTSDTVKYPLYSLTIENGVVPKSERYEREFLVTKDEDNFKVVNKNEFVYNPMNLRFGALARYKGDTPVSVSGYYNVFKVIDNSPESFWDNYLKTNRMMYIYNTIATGSLIEKRRVHFTQFIELKLPVPSKEEQEKIASFFSLIDDKISLQVEKLEMLKDYKLGMMQKIFGRELRFKDDEGRDYPEWEEKKLSEVSDVRDGTHDSPKYVENGYRFITSKNLSSNGKIDFSDINYICEEDYININKRSKVDIGDILFGMIGTIGNPVLVEESEFAIKNVALIKEKGELLNKYLIQVLNSSIISRQFHTLNSGGTQKFIALGVIRDLVIPVPKKQEQIKISNFLWNLDKRIDKEQEKLDSLKQYKKGLLQQMFV